MHSHLTTEQEDHQGDDHPDNDKQMEWSYNSHGSTLPHHYSAGGGGGGLSVANSGSSYMGGDGGAVAHHHHHAEPPLLSSSSSFFHGPNFSRAPSMMGSNSLFAIPSDAAIIQEIENLLDHHDLMQLSKKRIRDTLSDIFGMDMTCKKEFINRCIDELLSVRL